MPRQAKIKESSSLWADLVVSRQVDHRIRAGYGRRVPVPDIYPYSGRRQQQQQARQSRSPTPPRQSRSPTAQSPGFGPVFDNDDDGDAIMSDPALPLEEWEDINENDQEIGLIDQDVLADLDLTDIRRRLAELENDALPAAFDEDQLRLDIEYAEREYDREMQQPETVAFDEDFVDEWVADQLVEPEFEAAAPPVTERGQIFDTSELIQHYCNKQEYMSDFGMVLGLYAHVRRMSLRDYKIWLQMLSVLRGRDGQPIPAIQALPRQLATIKDRVSRRLPLLDMRMAQVPLQTDRMKTESARQKKQAEQARQRAQQAQQPEADANTAGPGSQQSGSDEDQSGTVMAPLYFMDPKSLFQAFLNSDTAGAMHKGMAHLVDNPNELFHSPCWSSSIRTTSGEYAHFVSNSDDNGKAIFPSDFIYFYCCKDHTVHNVRDVDNYTDEDSHTDHSNARCHCRLPDDHPDHRMHIGRVKGVGKNFTNNFREFYGEITLIVNECIPINQIEEEFPGLGLHFQLNHGMKFKKWELVLRLDVEDWIPQEWADQFAPVNVNYFDGNDLSDPSPAVDLQPTRGRAARNRKTFPKYTTQPDFEFQKNSFLVRRVLDDVADSEPHSFRVDNDSRNMKIYPLAFTPPIRAELEIKTFGREFFEEELDKTYARHGNDILSCPVLTFIDGFGVYRNAYRSVMGVYQSPAGLSFNTRARDANIFPVVLGPHASNFDDVVKALGCTMPLDRGIVMDVQGRPTLVSIFTLCYTGDMPQQNQNSGVVGMAGHKFCRFCFIGPEHVVNQQDVLARTTGVEINRYHHQHLQMRYEVDFNLWRMGDKNAYRTQWGISKFRPALFDLTPALDIILSRPPDPAHSEYKGIIAATHEMLLDVFLTAKAKVEYSRVLRGWPFPPGWSALPSPLSYILSYNLTHHAQWSVIAPPLFEAWLRKDHINPHAWEAWKAIHQPDRQEEEDDDDSDSDDEEAAADARLVGCFVRALAMMAQSNSILMNTRNTRQAYENVDIETKHARDWYTLLCQAASAAIAKNPRINAFQNRARADSGPSQASSTQRSSRLSSASGPSAGGPEEEQMAEMADPDDEEGGIVAAAAPADLPKRAKEYVRKALRPNVHLGVHYGQIYDEYGPPGLLNVLAEEKYHKRLKATAQTTNGRDVEKWILEQERIVHTIRFALLNSFAVSDPALTEQIQDIARDAPTLFDSLLHREDKQRIGMVPGNGTKKDEQEFDIPKAATKTHIQPSLTGKINNTVVRRMRHPIAGLSQCLPLSSRQMSDDFRRALSQACEIDYDVRILRFVPGALQYSTDLSFADSTSKRHSYSVGDHIRYRDGAIGRIDHIFVHEQKQYDERRIFLVLTKMIVTNRIVQSLALQTVEETGETLIVGLPAVKTDRIYIVDVSKISERNRPGHCPEWVLVNWDIIWL